MNRTGSRKSFYLSNTLLNQLKRIFSILSSIGTINILFQNKEIDFFYLTISYIDKFFVSRKCNVEIYKTEYYFSTFKKKRWAREKRKGDKNFRIMLVIYYKNSLLLAFLSVFKARALSIYRVVISVVIYFTCRSPSNLAEIIEMAFPCQLFDTGSMR